MEALTAIADEFKDQARQALTALDVERRLREAAERNCDDLRTALRMLEAGPRPTPEKRPGFFQRARERGEAMAEAELDAAALRSLADWKRFPRSRGR